MMRSISNIPDPERPGEPMRDPALGALLRDVVGETPVAGVDWQRLEARISGAVRAQFAAPWWGHVERWQRRAVPLALAAGLVGLLELWNATASIRADAAMFSGSPDLVTAVVSGEPAAAAATTLTGSLTSSVDSVIGVPE